MRSQLLAGNNVRAHCPDCNAITTFENGDASKSQPNFGRITIDLMNPRLRSSGGQALHYMLLRCAGCHRGGLAKVVQPGGSIYNLIWFFPNAIENASLPSEVPEDITAEFREAELCASHGATRAASALFRSTLEKTLKANGYISGNLYQKIEQACEDGIITAQRRRRAQEEIRVLGNDVLHDEWREVLGDEVVLSHHYTQRILEDFYDDTESVKILLQAAGRTLR